MSPRNTSRVLAAPSSLLSRCQRGQASVEYLGVIVASALLVLAVLSTPLPRMLGHAVAQAICDVSAVHGCQVGSPPDNSSQQTAHPAPQDAPLPSRDSLDETGARADAIHSAALTGASDTGTQTVDLPVPGQRNAQAEVEEFVRCLRQAQPSAHCRSMLRAPRDQSPSPDQRLRAAFQRACRFETYVPPDTLFVPRSPCQQRFDTERAGGRVLDDLADAPGVLGVLGQLFDQVAPNTQHPSSLLSLIPGGVVLDGVRGLIVAGRAGRAVAGGIDAAKAARLARRLRALKRQRAAARAAGDTKRARELTRQARTVRIQHNSTLGRIAERKAGITGPKRKVTIPRTGGRTRVPDAIVEKRLEVIEVKGGPGPLRYTKQLQDELTYARSRGKGWKLVLVTDKPRAQLDAALLRKIDDGKIVLRTTRQHRRLR